MKNNENRICAFRIRGLHSTLTLNMEEDHKMYRPAMESNNKSQSGQSMPDSDHTFKLKRKRTVKKPKGNQRRKACLALCSFPSCVENSQAAAVLFLLVLLSQVAHLLVGVVPPMPILLLNSTPQTAALILAPLLCAIQGPELWQGEDWTLLRPHIIRPHLSFTETKPSQSLLDYLGGTFKDEFYKKRKFYFPAIDAAVALWPELPPSVMLQIIQLSPLALPILFEQGRKVENRAVLELPQSSFDAYNPDSLKKLTKYTDDCYTEVALFLKWLCQKDKRIKRWQTNINCFRPVTRKGMFTIPQSDKQTEWLCAALALFQEFLIFASKHNDWITQEQAREILLRYWQLVLPESAPQADGSETEYECMDYKEPDIFYKFLTEYFLSAYHNQVLRGTKGTSETMALIRELDGETVFITPRKQFLELYARWMTEQHSPAFELGNEAALQRQLMEAGIPLRGEKNNPSTWRHAFYKERKDKVDCFALPITQLPEQVQAAFGSLFGSLSDTSAHPILAEAASNRFEEVNPL